MDKIDCNCLTGHWPFRMLRESGIDAIRKKHQETGIKCGLVANMNSIFYNDPFEGVKELDSLSKEKNYLHVMTVNPMLPGFEEDIDIAVEEYNICAVRIYPGYHKYKLNDNQYVESLCSLLDKRDIPLFISLRLEDERLNYLIKPLTPEEFGLPEFVGHTPACNTLLLTIRLNEVLTTYKEQILSSERIWFDTSGLKERAFGIEDLYNEIGIEKLVYGSQYPLFSLRSTLYSVERSNLEEKTKNDIFWNNAQRLMGRDNKP